MNGKPQCRKHNFTLSHFCSFSRSYCTAAISSSFKTGTMVAFFPGGLAWQWHHRSILCLPPFNSIQEAQKAAISRIDWTYQLNWRGTTQRSISKPATALATYTDTHKKRWETQNLQYCEMQEGDCLMEPAAAAAPQVKLELLEFCHLRRNDHFQKLL